MHTIEMPAAYLKKWLEGLRSGKYKRGQRTLKTHDGKYCCLGVLQQVVDGDVERFDSGVTKGLPSLEWLKKHNIKFFSTVGDEYTPSVPYLPKLGTTASLANDRLCCSFKQIADAIEACAKPV